VFQHYPVGGDNHYIGNPDELIELLDAFDVPVVFAGHIHRLQLNRQNGVAMIALPGILNLPAYHWVRVDRGVLSVSQAERTGAGWTTTSVADIPLRRAGRAPEAPRGARLEPASDRSQVAIEVRLGTDARPSSVRARVWPERTWGGSDGTGWVDLVRDPGSPKRWSGSLATGTLAAGSYRVQIRTVDGAGALQDRVERVQLPRREGERLRERDARRLGSSVQADIAETPGGVVAATLGGRVCAFDVDRRGLRERWSVDVGGRVLARPLVDPTGRSIYVAGADRRVTALEAHSGRIRWRAALPGAALASPAWTDSIDAAPGGALLAGAERTLLALDASTGQTLWQTAAGGFVGGRPAADELAVYVGAGDGKAHAFDLQSGAPLWERLLSTRTTNGYQTMIYGPWEARVVLLTGGRVIVSTVSSTTALDRASGEVAWRIPGSTLYAAALLVDDGRQVVLVDEQGGVKSADSATGAVTWTTQISQRVIGGSPALWQGLVAIAGVNGLIALIDPATGATVERLHPTVDYQYGAPAVAGDLLVVGGQDGVLRALTR
jgi:outer membrane protein assembly factor BamB